MKKIALVAEVGIFWVFRGRVYACKESLSSLRYEDGTKAANYFHQAEWERVKKKIAKDFPDFDIPLKYNEVPRGRIWQEQKDSLFVLIGSQVIVSDTEMVDKVLEKFNISKSANISLQSDAIYER